MQNPCPDNSRRSPNITIMKTTFVIFCALIIVLIGATVLLAQPPGLPDAPNQAPLGGLGLLAAAGGAYAWKKLRNRKN